MADTTPISLAAARGTLVAFEEGFWSDPDLQTDPLVPIDPNAYPAVVVRSPDGQAVRSGIGLPVVEGIWRFEFGVPADAALSNHEMKWSIEWTMLTQAGRTVTTKRYFSVVEQKVAQSEDRDLVLLCRCGLSQPVELRRETDAYFLSAELRAYPGHTTKVAYTYDPQKPLNSTITRKVVGNEVVYHLDTPPLDLGEYIVFWNVQDTKGSPIVGYDRVIRVPPAEAHFMFPSLRALIDKLRKRTTWLQAYTTSDLYEYLIQGLDVLNAMHPTTSMGFQNVPLGDGGTRMALYCAAALHAMDAQMIMAVETDFDFGGQKVPLKVDRKSGYQAVVERMEKRLADWKQSKTGLYRRFNLVGASSVRPVNRRWQNMVVPVGGNRGGLETLSLLSAIGLL